MNPEQIQWLLDQAQWTVSKLESMGADIERSRKTLQSIYRLMCLCVAAVIVLAVLSCCVWFMFFMPSMY